MLEDLENLEYLEFYFLSFLKILRILILYKDNINIPPKIDSSRYEIFEPFLITNQWGLDVDKDSSFELLLKSICDTTLKDLKQKPSNKVLEYKENDFNNEWKEILSGAGITQIKIYLDK